IYCLFAVVALMGAQSALFGPAKFGSIPEILRADKLSTGNGLMGLVTVVASAGGFLAGNWLFSLTEPDLKTVGDFTQIRTAAFALLGVAVAGWLTSLQIVRVPVANPQRTVSLNPFADTGRYLRLLTRDIPLFRAALGIAFFWFLASLVQVTIDSFGISVL